MIKYGYSAICAEKGEKVKANPFKQLHIKKILYSTLHFIAQGKQLNRKKRRVIVLCENQQHTFRMTDDAYQ